MPDERLAKLQALIRSYPDFPKKGILFRDMLPILRHPESLKTLIDIACEQVNVYKPTCIAGIEARGFLIGTLIAQNLNISFVPLRKKGKLPGQLVSMNYTLEYGTDCLQIQKDAITAGQKCIIVDDLLATGGTLLAAKNLLLACNADVACCFVIMELTDLKGKDFLGSTPLISLFNY